MTEPRNSEAPKYIHLKFGDAPPKFDGAKNFKAIVVIEGDVTSQWREQISDWLVLNGCRYMMAWGKDCRAWDDSVDLACLSAFNFQVPEDGFVMTTWHEREQLKDVFWFSTQCAMHPTLELKQTYILDISPFSRERELLALFSASGPTS